MALLPELGVSASQRLDVSRKMQATVEVRKALASPGAASSVEASALLDKLRGDRLMIVSGGFASLYGGRGMSDMGDRVSAFEYRLNGGKWTAWPTVPADERTRGGGMRYEQWRLKLGLSRDVYFRTQAELSKERALGFNHRHPVVMYEGELKSFEVRFTLAGNAHVVCAVPVLESGKRCSPSDPACETTCTAKD